MWFKCFYHQKSESFFKWFVKEIYGKCLVMWHRDRDLCLDIDLKKSLLVYFCFKKRGVFNRVFVKKV